jgi:uncharacterized coiled-coil protein SlyX
MDRISEITIRGPARLTLLEIDSAAAARALSENNGSIEGAKADLKIGKTKLKRLLGKIRRSEAGNTQRHSAGEANEQPEGGE